MTNVRFLKEKVEKNEIGYPMTHQYINQHRDKAHYNDRESGGSVVHTFFLLAAGPPLRFWQRWGFMPHASGFSSYSHLQKKLAKEKL